MALAFRAASTAASGAAVSSLLVTKPTGVVNDDVMVAFVTIGADQTVTSAPAGWTLLGSNNTGGSTGDCRHYVYWKKAASEGANYTWGFSAGVDCAIAIVAYTGADLTTPIDVSASSLNSASTLTLTAPGITPTVTNTVVLYAFGCNSGVTGNLTFTPQASLTPRAEADPAGSTTNRAAVAVFSEGKSTTNAEGTKTCTIDDTAKGVAWSVVLAPATVGGGGAPPTTITIETTTATSSTGGCMLGWYDDSNDVDAAIQRAVDLGVSGWGVIRLYHDPNEFPNIKENATEDIIAANSIPMVSHKPPKRGGSWIEIWRGDHSASIDAWVAYYKSLAPAKIIFIFHHEPHDNCTDLKPEKGLEGEASDFVKAYRYIGNKFRAANADNVLLGYCAVLNTWANKKATGSTVLGSGDKCWPGDDLVDVLCHDEYNTAGEDHAPNPSTGVVTYVSGQVKASAKGETSITFSLSNVQAGDLLLANLQCGYINLNHSQSNGWTLKEWREEDYGSNPDSNNPRLTGGKDLCGYVFYKIAAGNETSVTFTSNNTADNADIGGGVTVWRGVDTANPFEAVVVDGQTAGDTVECPSVSGLNGGALICHFIKDDPEVMNDVSGMTTIGKGFVPNNSTHEDYTLLAYKFLTVTGATGVKSSSYIDQGDGAANDMGWSVSLKPSGTGAVYSYGGTSWHSFEEEYTDGVVLAKRWNKPLVCGEIGSNHSKPQGTRDEWFRDGAAWIKNSQDAQDYLRGFCYYHVDNHDDSGHWWRFVNDADTMFKGDGQIGFIQGFLQDAYFKTEPIDIFSDNVETSEMQGGIPPAVAFGFAGLEFVTVGITTITQAGGVASPSTYDPVDQVAGLDFGVPTLIMPSVILPAGMDSLLAFGTATLSRHAAYGYYFEPPVRYYTGGVLPRTSGPQRRLFSHYRGAPVGQNVYVTNGGVVTESPPNINDIAAVYHGGHKIPITDEEYEVLAAAGYDPFITAIVRPTETLAWWSGLADNTWGEVSGYTWGDLARSPLPLFEET